MNQLLEKGPGQVDLWFCIPQRIADAGLEGYCQSLLMSDELDQYQSLKLSDHRREYLVSHAMLRAVLSRYLVGPPESWQFRRNDFGKPELVTRTELASRLRFNLSHTNGMAVCAIGLDTDIGVDVEFHANSQGLLEVADHYFSEREVGDLLSLPEGDREQAFFRYWTLKEAYIKAKGEGLSIALDSFSFIIDRSGGIEFWPPQPDQGLDWSFQLFYPGEGYTAAVAAQSARMHVRLFESGFDSYRELDSAAELTEL